MVLHEDTHNNYSIRTVTRRPNGGSATIATTRQLCSTAELTLPSSASHATVKSTRLTSSSPSILAHSSAMPVTIPKLQFFALLRAVYFARTVTGKGTTFPYLRCTIEGLSRSSLVALLWLNCRTFLGLRI